jgi:hypothetical protein
MTKKIPTPAVGDSRPADLEKMGFRAGVASDRDATIRLFREAYSRRLAPRVWEWRFLRNPAGKGIIELAWDGTTLAGHYAVSPVRMRIRGRDVLAALSGTTMTHSGYRGLGLFPLLARRTYERARRAGHMLVMGFPNKNSHRGLVRDLTWKDVHEVPKFAASVSAIGQVGHDPGIVELTRFDPRFDRLWDEVKDDCPISVIRDRRYLQWRYVDNPEDRYRIFACEDRRTIAGYVVAKRYEKELHIVDILCRDADTGVRLVRRVARVASKAGLQVVSMWLNPGLELHRELERVGFQPCALVTYFCVLRLGPAVRPYDFRDWYLTMGDSDVY